MFTFSFVLTYIKFHFKGVTQNELRHRWCATTKQSSKAAIPKVRHSHQKDNISALSPLKTENCDTKITNIAS